MTKGLETTLQVLAKNDNEASVGVLISALDSPHTDIQEGALSALLKRRSPAGGREILSRLPDITPRWKEIIRQHYGRMTKAVRDAILGTDQKLMVKGCQAAVWFREYDLVATLLNVIEDGTADNSQTTANTLLAMAVQLYDELAGPRDYNIRRDPQVSRQHTVSSLELSVKRFSHHKRREVIEAFLLLVGRDNVTLKQILQDPHHVAFLTTIDVLSHSGQGGVIRLLLSFLDDPHVPSSAMSVIANRSDLKFVQYLLRKIGREPSAMASQNLKRVESIAWLRDGETFLDQLDDAAQHGVVRLVMASGAPRAHAFAVVKHLLLHGKSGGRREAARALAEFSGSEANLLALKALGDPDPQVQANVVVQLRNRGIPGILARMVELIDSPHAIVRKAARKGLDEFSFKRFISAFDMLEDDVRRSTGMLVKKIDPRTMPLLQEELHSRLRTHRIRGLAVARAIDAVDQFEHVIIELLADDDHMVRVEAAATLARCMSESSRLALAGALNDSSPAVQEAARNSLDEQCQTA